MSAVTSKFQVQWQHLWLQEEVLGEAWGGGLPGQAVPAKVANGLPGLAGRGEPPVGTGGGQGGWSPEEEELSAGMGGSPV